jgi:hypothetical protein
MSQTPPVTSMLKSSLGDFNRWWTVLSTRVYMSAKLRMPDSVVPASDLLGADNQKGWQEVEDRLLLLTIEPTDKDGLEVCALIYDLVRLLGDRVQATVNNKSGIGFGKAPLDKVIDEQIMSVVALLQRVRTLREALQQITQLAAANPTFPAPPGQDSWGAEGAWQLLSEEFNRDRYTALKKFHEQLIEFKNRRDDIINQIDGALTTGRLDMITLDGIHPDFSEHPTKRHLAALHEHKRNLYTELRELQAQVTRCLEYQHLDATPWSQPLPLPITRRDPQAAPLEFGERTKAIEQYHRHKALAATPVEFKSLLEAAWELLRRMKRKDPQDSCGFQQKLEWVNTPTGSPSIGFIEIEEALQENLKEINNLRKWLHPIAGGQMYQVGTGLRGDAQGRSSASDWSVVPYLKLRADADAHRRRREFTEAIRILDGEILGTPRDTSPGVQDQPPTPPGPTYKPLPEVVTYIRSEKSDEALHPRTGVGKMLVSYAKRQLVIYECETALARRGLDTLRAWESEHEVRWRTFEGDLNAYRGMKIKADRAFVNKKARQDEATQAKSQAIGSYYMCHQLCPDDPHLITQRENLGIPDSDYHLAIVEKLWMEQDDCARQA